MESLLLSYVKSMFSVSHDLLTTVADKISEMAYSELSLKEELSGKKNRRFVMGFIYLFNLLLVKSTDCGGMSLVIICKQLINRYENADLNTLENLYQIFDNICVLVG